MNKNMLTLVAITVAGIFSLAVVVRTWQYLETFGQLLMVAAFAALFAYGYHKYCTWQLHRRKLAAEALYAEADAKVRLAEMRQIGLAPQFAQTEIQQQVWAALAIIQAGGTFKNASFEATALRMPASPRTTVEGIPTQQGQVLIAGPAISTTADTLHLSDTYRMPADDMLSGRGLLAGSSGSGKSNATAVIVEELAQLRVPLILADTEGEYDSLRDTHYLPNYYDASELTIDNARQFARYMLENQLQVILNLQEHDFDTAAVLMCRLVEGLKEWQEERENERRIPCQFILEEAVTWLPQNIKESPLAEDTLNALHRAFFNDLARKGRKRGLGILTIVQRIAEIDKRICNHSNYRILLRQSLPADLQIYSRMGVKPEEAQDLKNGQGYLYSSAEVKKLIQVRLRHSPHGANSPGLEALRRHQQGRNVVDERRKPYEPFNDDLDGFQELSELSSDTENTPSSWQVTRTTGKLESDVKTLQKSDESIPQFSEEEERQIIQIARTQIATYGRVIRSKIPDAMNPKRNNAIYPAVKYICDREGL